MHRRHASAFVLLPVAALVGNLEACGGSSPAPLPSPSPHPPIGQTAVLLAAGDIGECGVPGAAATGTLLDATAGTIVALGDQAYFQGTEAEYRNCFDPAWGRHRARIRPIPGNHDYETPGAAGFFGYFGAAAGPDGYYSYRLGSWLVIALNSNIALGPGSPQYEWLQGELNANAPACTAAVIHHPLFSSSENGPNRHVRPLWALLYDAGVEFVLSGHDHVYERFAPMDPDGRADAAGGIRQFVVGTGGGALYRFVGTRPGSEAQVVSWGVLRVEVAHGRYDWEFVPVRGASGRDSGSTVCH